MASHSRRKGSCELDQYAPSMAEELLSGLNDWKHVPDIIRLTFKALSDIIQTQGAAIHELERQMPGKASKSELTAGLSSKASISDMTQAILEANASWKDQCSSHKLESLLTEKVSKAELSSILRTSVTEKDVRTLLEQKVSTRIFETEVKALQDVLEEMQRNHLAQIQRIETQIQELCQLLDQKADSSEVEKLAQGKANRQSVINALYTKVSKEDLEAALATKANSDLVEDCLAGIRAMQHTIDSVIDHNAELLGGIRADAAAQAQTFERQMSAIRSELASVSTNSEVDAKQLSLITAQLDQKADTEKVTSVFTAFKVDISDIAGVLKKEQSAIEEKCSAQICDVMKNCEKSAALLDGRLKQLQESLFAVSGELAGKCEELDSRLASVHSTSNEAKNLHCDVLTLIEDLNKRKAENKDISEVRRVLSDSLAKQGEYCSAQKYDFEKYKEALLEHVQHTQADLTRYVESVAMRQSHQDLVLLQKELAACARSKDIQPLLDAKANLDDLTRGLLDLHKDLEARVSLPEFQTLFTELKSATETLLLENCTARWLWTSGALKTDRRIPWEVQTVNTRPDNFIWEEGQFTVYTVAPGLYEVSLGVFTRVRPKVQLFVNDQAVFRLGYSDGDTGKQWVPHIDGNLIGQTMKDVVALPTRARIYVTYEGEWRAEAFLWFRKL